MFKMDFREFKNFTNFSKRKLDNIIASSDKYNLDSSNYKNNIHKLSNLLKTHYNSDISILETSIPLTSAFTEYQKTKSMSTLMDQMWCGYYEKSPHNILSYHEQHLFTRLHHLMSDNKMIFVFLDLHDYLLQPEDEDEDCHEGVIHSTTVFLYQDECKKYRAFYFNSYGQYGTTLVSYDLYISRKRKTRLALNRPVDFIIIDQLVKSYNMCAPYYFDNCVSLRYEMTEEFNYLGPNYQQGDYYGVCFIYPFVVLYHLLSEFYSPNFLENKEGHLCRIPSYRVLLKRNQLNNVILVIMSKIFKNLRIKFLEYYLNPTHEKYLNLNEIVDADFEKRNTFHIKQIYSKTIEFVLQTPLRQFYEK